METLSVTKSLLVVVYRWRSHEHQATGPGVLVPL